MISSFPCSLFVQISPFHHTFFHSYSLSSIFWTFTSCLLKRILIQNEFNNILSHYAFHDTFYCILFLMVEVIKVSIYLCLKLVFIDSILWIIIFAFNWKKWGWEFYLFVEWNDQYSNLKINKLIEGRKMRRLKEIIKSMSQLMIKAVKASLWLNHVNK